jgi:hypothetical protein
MIYDTVIYKTEIIDGTGAMVYPAERDMVSNLDQ